MNNVSMFICQWRWEKHVIPSRHLYRLSAMKDRVFLIFSSLPHFSWPSFEFFFTFLNSRATQRTSQNYFLVFFSCEKYFSKIFVIFLILNAPSRKFVWWCFLCCISSGNLFFFSFRSQIIFSQQEMIFLPSHLFSLSFYIALLRLARHL